MKWIRGVWFIFLLVAAGLLVSCSHKAPATRQDREKWNQTMLNSNYVAVGSQNSKWDKDAKDALADFSLSRTASSDEANMLSQSAGDSAGDAIEEGCNDPMIRYLYVRYSTDAKGKPYKDRQDLYLSAAQDLQGSSYPAIWKFYANVDAAEMLWANRDHAWWKQVVQLRHAAISNLGDAVQDKSLPEAEAYDAASALFQLLQYNVGEMTNAYNQVESALAQQPDKAAMADFIKATFYIQYAWKARQWHRRPGH